MVTQQTCFSVIIATTGYRASLQEAVASVLQQSHHDFELVIVLDGPRNLPPGLDIEADPRIRLVRQPQRGAAAARNVGVLHSTHSWVAFLDDDDRARPNWLSTLALEAKEHLAVVTAGVRYDDGRGNAVHRWCELNPKDPTMQASSILVGGFAVRREVFAAVGGYDERLTAAENQDLGLRLCDLLLSQPQLGGSRAIREVLVDVTVQPTPEREERYGSAWSDAAIVLLDRHSERLATDPRDAAALLRIVASWNRRSGNFNLARRAAMRACMREASNMANWRSLLLSAFPRTANAIRRFSITASGQRA